MNTLASSFPRRIFWYFLLGIALYWIGNLMAVFPWLISKTFGIIAMMLSTILWGYITFYSLKHVPRNQWNRDTLCIAVIFLITAVIQDFFLYAVFRGIPDELYVTSTFIAYGTVLLLPFIVRYIILGRYNQRKVLLINHSKLIITAIIAAVSCAVTLWSVKFW